MIHYLFIYLNLPFTNNSILVYSYNCILIFEHSFEGRTGNLLFELIVWRLILQIKKYQFAIRWTYNHILLAQTNHFICHYGLFHVISIEQLFWLHDQLKLLVGISYLNSAIFVQWKNKIILLVYWDDSPIDIVSLIILH